MSQISKEELVSYLKPFGQDHLVAFWNELNEEEKIQLKDDIDSIDFHEVNSSFKRIQEEKDAITQDIDSNIEPVPAELKGSFVKSTQDQLEKYEAEGLKAIASGQVAVLLLAGGQGTRLGVNYPKGMYSVDLLSGKTLYQLQAERLIKIKELALQRFPALATDSNKGSIPWYIMTSEHTQESTISYFKSNGYFGLDKENFFLFEQFMLPCLTNEGKVILDQKNKISKAPDGNGGLYKALRERRVLDDMEKRGIKYVHVYCVDNILVKMADPLFIGFCIEKNANCAAKV
jgi:UDP-N-acetylglucosamine/UDP-N-acetylgalactosamine diphosphorylase